MYSGVYCGRVGGGGMPVCHRMFSPIFTTNSPQHQPLSTNDDDGHRMHHFVISSHKLKAAAINPPIDIHTHIYLPTPTHYIRPQFSSYDVIICSDNVKCHMCIWGHKCEIWSSIKSLYIRDADGHGYIPYIRYAIWKKCRSLPPPSFTRIHVSWI